MANRLYNIISESVTTVFMIEKTRFLFVRNRSDGESRYSIQVYRNGVLVQTILSKHRLEIHHMIARMVKERRGGK